MGSLLSSSLSNVFTSTLSVSTEELSIKLSLVTKGLPWLSRMMKSSDSFAAQAWIRSRRSRGICTFVAFFLLIGLPVELLKYLQVPCLFPVGYAVNLSIVRGTLMRLVVLVSTCTNSPNLMLAIDFVINYSIFHDTSR